MSTGLIDTRPTKVGDVLKYEVDPFSGYTREDVVVTVPVGGLEVGAVLESTSVPGKYTLTVAATGGDADGVLIDSEVNNIKPDSLPADFTLAVLVNGPAQVSRNALSFGADIDTDPEKDTVVDALEANTGIKTIKTV